MHGALFYESTPGAGLKCTLCPHLCLIGEGGHGRCGVRVVRKGVLYSEVYGIMTSVAVDPVEKKPLYHYHPGERILSLGTRGCNLKCGFCQNWQISQDLKAPVKAITPAEVVALAKKAGSFGIAYTYNEPFIWYEFVEDTARLARASGLENVLVTNGYVNMAPLDRLLPLINAMNIDLKSFDDRFYRDFCGGSLEPVLSTIEASAKRCHVELTTLIIPTLNDDMDGISRMVDWICDHVGPDTPLHLSRYFPCYKFDLPQTPHKTLQDAEATAKKRLRYVYIGNV